MSLWNEPLESQGYFIAIARLFYQRSPFSQADGDAYWRWVWVRADSRRSFSFDTAHLIRCVYFPSPQTCCEVGSWSLLDSKQLYLCWLFCHLWWRIHNIYTHTATQMAELWLSDQRISWNTKEQQQQKKHFHFCTISLLKVQMFWSQAIKQTV